MQEKVTALSLQYKYVFKLISLKGLSCRAFIVANPALLSIVVYCVISERGDMSNDRKYTSG